MIYLMSVGCGMQFAGKKWIWPGVKRMAGVGEHGGSRRFRGGRGGGGRRLGVWRAEKMNIALVLQVEEALLAIHVASNGSQESTNPNCTFRLQDPHGIQGHEGRFRVRTRFAGSTRARPASAATATMRSSSVGGDDNDTLVPPRRRARARARPPLHTLRA